MTPVPDKFSDDELRKGFDGAKFIKSERDREYGCRIAGSKLLVWLACHETKP